MSGQALHQSVLLNEVVDALGPQNGGCYLDATFGNGGYSRAILDTANCTLLAIDRDPDAIARGEPMLAEYDGRFHLAEGCFSGMTALLQAQLTGFNGLDGAARSDARAKARTVRLFVAMFHFNPKPQLRAGRRWEK